AGAQFTVSLPTEPAAPGIEATPEAAPVIIAPTPRGARVLVVDDEPAVCRLLHEVLAAHFGCIVDVATNGVEAFELLAANRYALVLSDIRMPMMNGTELYLWLREAQPTTARRLVFVTGHAGEKYLEAEIAQWGTPVIAKPFT